MTQDEFRREKLYLSTMVFARKLLSDGAISEDDYYHFDIKMRAKYRPKSGDLLSGKPLIEARVRALMDVRKEAGNGKGQENTETTVAGHEGKEESCSLCPGVVGE